MFYALFFALASFSATANTPAASDSIGVIEQAEYNRLRQEMHRLVERQAWQGVERAYIGCVETGVSLKFSDFVAGASAANALGNVGNARERLWSAHQLQEDREVIDWMWAIDSEYGQANLAIRPGREGLIVDEIPFAPSARNAIALAQHGLDDEGRYNGLLPAGDYQLGDASFQIQGLQRRPVKVDLVPEPTRGFRWFRPKDARRRARR